MNRINSHASSKSGIWRRILSLMLAVCMVVSMTTAAYAEGIPESPEASAPAAQPELPTTQDIMQTEPAPGETETPTEAETPTGGEQPEVTDPASGETPALSEQAGIIIGMISALPLPEEVNGDNADQIRAALEEILILYGQLDPAEQEAIDISPCYMLQMKLGEMDSAQTFGGADEANATAVSASDTEWSSGFYKVTESLTIPNNVRVNGDVTIILTDGTTLTVNGSIIVNEGNSITINGKGALNVTAGDGYAGIGGEYKNIGGKITINDGIINVTSTTGAAIGGGRDISDPAGDIIINGGNITATSTTGGAGIGGGYGQSCGNITITGGTVTAKSTYDSVTGAGIGGGAGGNGGTIKISSGTVTAESGYGAGIGGGSLGIGTGGNGGTITITGGTVFAKSKHGAAIGGGSKRYSESKIGEGGNITITGGSVTALGGKTNGYYNAIAPDIGGNGGSFSTGTDGHAIINASSISDQSGKDSWSGIIFEGNDGTVYGNQVLNENFTLESGKTLTINEGSSLSVGETLTNNGSITNNGTFAIAYGGNITGEGTITGSETAVFATENLTEDMISVPEIVFNGDPYGVKQLIIDRIEISPANICGQKFVFEDTEVYSLNVALLSEIEYLIKYTSLVDGSSVEKAVTILQSATELTATPDKSDYTYTDTITVTATVAPTGEAPVAAVSTFSLTEPTAMQMALFYGVGENEVQVSEPVAYGGGAYSLSVPVSELINAGAPYDMPITLTAKFVGYSAMADASAEVTVTLHKAELTITGATIEDKTYDTNSIATVESITFKDSNDAVVSLDIDTDYTASARFTDADGSVGNNKDVWVRVDEFKNPNYILENTTFETTGNIIPLELNYGDVEIRFADGDNPTYTWEGTAIEPKVSVYYRISEEDTATTLIPESEYTVSYKHNGGEGQPIVSNNPPQVVITFNEGSNYTYGGYELSESFTIICEHNDGFSGNRCRVCGKEMAVAVEIDGVTTAYDDIVAAWNYAQGKTAKITLYKSVEVTEQLAMINGNTNITMCAMNYVTLTKTSNDIHSLFLLSGGTLTLESGIYKDVKNECILASGPVTLYIKGGDYTGGVGEAALVVGTNDANVKLYGGTFHASSGDAVRVAGSRNLSAILADGYTLYKADTIEALSETELAATSIATSVFVEKAGANVAGELDLTEPEGTSGSGTGYSWTWKPNDSGEYNKIFDLYLDSITVPGNIALPDNQDSITIHLKGDSTVGGFVSTKGYNYGGYYNDSTYGYHIVITGDETTPEADTLEVGGRLGSYSGTGSTLVINKGADVTVKGMAESVGTITVKGNLTSISSAEKAVNTGKLTIDGGKLTVYGKKGIEINGIYTGYDRNFDNAFVMTANSTLIVDCQDCNIMIGTSYGGVTDPKTAVSIADGCNIPEGFKLHEVLKSDGSYTLTIAPEHLVLTDFAVSIGNGVGGYLEISSNQYKAVLASADPLYSTGEPLTPAFTVTDKAGAALNEAAYTVTYENNLTHGTGIAVIEGKEPNRFRIIRTFEILCGHPKINTTTGKCVDCDTQFAACVQYNQLNPEDNQRTITCEKFFDSLSEAWEFAVGLDLTDVKEICGQLNAGVEVNVYKSETVNKVLEIPEDRIIYVSGHGDNNVTLTNVTFEVNGFTALSYLTINYTDEQYQCSVRVNSVRKPTDSEYLDNLNTHDITLNSVEVTSPTAIVTLERNTVVNGKITVCEGRTVGELLRDGESFKKQDDTWAALDATELTGPVTVVSAPVTFFDWYDDEERTKFYEQNSSNENVTAIDPILKPRDNPADMTIKWLRIPEGKTDAEEITDATARTYTPDISKPGVTQYYCEVTYQGYTAKSPVFTVTVTECQHSIDPDGTCTKCGAAFAVCVMCMNDNPEQSPEDKYFETIEAAFAYAIEAPGERVQIEVLKDLTVENTLTVPEGKSISLHGRIMQEKPPAEGTPEGPAEVLRPAVITGPEQGAAIAVDGSLVVDRVVINSSSHNAIQVTSDHEAALEIYSAEIDGLDVTGMGGIKLMNDAVIRDHITLPEGRALSELFAEGYRYNSTLKVTSENGDSFRWLYTEDLAKNSISGDMIAFAPMPIRFVGDWFSGNRYEKDAVAEAIQIPYAKNSETAETIEWFKVTENGTEVITDADGTVVNDTEAGLSKFIPNTSVTGESKYICRITCDDYIITTPEIIIVVYEEFTVTATSMLDGMEGTTVVPIIIMAGDGIHHEDNKFLSGDRVRVSFEERVSSCKFLGWYNGDTLFSSERNLEFTVKENLNLVAKFESYGTAAVTIEPVNGAQIKYGDIIYTGTTTKDISIGTMIELFAANPDMVSAWLNGSDKVIGKDGSIRFTVTGNMTIKLVYNLPEDSTTQTAMVQYVSGYGQLLLYKAFTAEEALSITPPVAPSKLGYTFTGWSLDPQGISDAITAGEKQITVTPKYTKSDETCTVTIVYSGNEAEPKTITCNLGDSINITADELPDKVFSHWTDETGRILGYTPTYQIKIASDITLTAHYSDTEVEPQPIIEITAKFASNVGEGKNKISFVATRSIPEKYMILEHGLIYVMDSALANETDFVYNGDKVYMSVSIDPDNNGTFTGNFNMGTHVDYVIHVRGYAIVRDRETGNIMTVYSGIESGSYTGLGGK